MTTLLLVLAIAGLSFGFGYYKGRDSGYKETMREVRGAIISAEKIIEKRIRGFDV